LKGKKGTNVSSNLKNGLYLRPFFFVKGV